MSSDLFLSYLQSALTVVLIVSSAPLLVAIVVGLGIGLLQALTQIQDQALPQAFKLIGIMLVMILAGPLLAQPIVQLASQVFEHFPEWVR
ncbi:EscS/YscS/HrcS family type III secretion system export apparatus protein [Salinisphaera sp.]|uniref:EscS/YscS/HrcS family type III secretion system export apparatus protein n=1 Tax=Salinisphaera sp. TaxID=1914330 RepID=UPI002D7A1937|nr:flagellar biosynthetic protein FliQ [Salinisphaera sp.]HET7314008.1 flagellar biosynthetic protein FliQ [Salinisphaera sp.]